jgi:phage gpG-like protein
MISAVVIGAPELQAEMEAMPALIRQLVLAKMQSLAIELQRHIVQDKLSGQVLKVRTSNLRASIQQTVKDQVDNFQARVFSSGDVKYAAIHEFGGVIVPKKAKALSFVIDGKRIFTKQVIMPKRSYMRTSLEDQKDAIVKGLMAAVAGGIKAHGTS